MGVLFSSLGIDWRLFLSQATNFLILLAVLAFFVWRPLKIILEERRRKIELGVRMGEEAAIKLAEIENLKSESLARSEREAEDLLRLAERDAAKRSESILDEARKKGEEVVAGAKMLALHEKAFALKDLERNAAELLKSALVHAVGLKPDEVDTRLLADARAAIKKEIGEI